MPRTTTIMALTGALTLLGCGDDAHGVGERADEAWPGQDTAPAANDDQTTAAHDLEPASGETASANDTGAREDAIDPDELEPVSGEMATAPEATPARGEIATANEAPGSDARPRRSRATAASPTARGGGDTPGSASRRAGSDFGIWDEDADVRISRREFLRGVDRSYPMWERFDDDGSGSVSRTEMVSGLYGAWRDEDALSGPELRSAVTRWFGVDWSVERIDDADVVSRAELDRFLDRHGVFEALDRDADRSLDPFELGLAFFEHWDLNDDGFIDEVEWITA